MGELVNYKDCRLEIRDDTHINYSDDYQNSAIGEVEKDDLVRGTVDRFVYWIEKYGDPIENRCNGEDLQILGLHLYNILFDKESRENPETKEKTSVRNCFERAYRNFENDRKKDKSLRLRIILTFYQEANKLAAYPWEFIRMPWKPESFFLAGKKTELILTRCVPEAGVEEKLDPEERPLKILIACSTPQELGTVDAEGVIQFIKGMHKDGLIEVDTVKDPTSKNIAAKLIEMRPHIFHFIGHGRADPKESKPQVALMREPEEIRSDQALLSAADQRRGTTVPEAAWTDGDVFAALFKDTRPRLVFLHACKGAAAGYKFHSTALDLVKAKIPAVVAMQYEISNDDANAFAQKFYQHIDDGRSVDDAVSEGRWELGIFRPNRGAWSDRGFGAPVIYLQSKGAVIAPRPPEKKTQEASAEEHSAPAKVRCPYPDDLVGWVIPGKSFCSTCKRQIMQCPNGHVMPKEIGYLCEDCGFRLDAGTSELTPASVQAPGARMQSGQPSPAVPAPAGGTGTTAVDIRSKYAQ